jgi:ketosteroid isomerase-like protein
MDGDEALDGADGTSVVREYYRALDAHDYDALSRILASGFVHDRPDRTIEGREAFVAFMREDRPQTDTTHDIDALYGRLDGDGEWVARGRLRDSDGDVFVWFVDVFTVEDGHVARIDTYTQ